MMRGEVWMGVWPNDPEKKERPLLIVSNNHRNQGLHILDVIVVKLTSLYRGDGSAKVVNNFEDYVMTFKKPTIIRCGSIYSVEKLFLKRKISQLSVAEIKEIDTRLKIVLNLDMQ